VETVTTSIDTKGRKQPTKRKRPPTKPKKPTVIVGLGSDKPVLEAEIVPQVRVEPHIQQQASVNLSQSEELHALRRENLALKSEIAELKDDMSATIRERYVALMRKLSKAARIAELKQVLTDLGVTVADLAAEPERDHPGKMPDIPDFLRRAP
jgi:hypothetical protein